MTVADDKYMAFDVLMSALSGIKRHHFSRRRSSACGKYDTMLRASDYGPARHTSGPHAMILPRSSIKYAQPLRRHISLKYWLIASCNKVITFRCFSFTSSCRSAIRGGRRRLFIDYSASAIRRTSYTADDSFAFARRSAALPASLGEQFIGAARRTGERHRALIRIFIRHAWVQLTGVVRGRENRRLEMAACAIC